MAGPEMEAPAITRALVAAIMHSAQPMVLTDPNAPDHPMIAVNPAFEAMSLYPAAETVGRNCRFLQGPNTDTVATARLRSCIAERRGSVEWLLNYRRDGSQFWNLLFICPIYGPDGALLHYFGNQRDITEGSPATLPDYTLGKADLSAAAQAEFQALLQQMVAADAQAPDTARALEALGAAARRLDELTTRLQPAPWAPPR